MNRPLNPESTRKRNTPLLLGSLLAFSVFVSLVPSASAAVSSGLCSVTYAPQTDPVLAGSSFGNNAVITSFDVNASLAAGDKLQMVFPAGTSFDGGLAAGDIDLRQSKTPADVACRTSAGAGTPVTGVATALSQSGSGGATPTLVATIPLLRADGLGPVLVKIGSSGLIDHPTSLSASHNFTLSVLTSANAVKMGPVKVLVDIQIQASASESTIEATPESKLASSGGSVAILVQGKDPGGNNITVGGATICLHDDYSNLLLTSTSGHGPLAACGSDWMADDQGDGTYTATLTNPGTPAIVTVTGILNGTSMDDDEEIRFVGTFDAGQSEVEADPDSVPADNSTLASVFIQLQDALGSDLLGTGAKVCMNTTLGTWSSSTGCGTGGRAAGLGGGLYRADLKSASVGSASITIQVDGANMNGGDPYGSLVEFTAVPLADNSTIDAASPIAANGVSSSAIVVVLRDSANQTIGAGAAGHLVCLEADLGALDSDAGQGDCASGEVEANDEGDGSYTASLDSILDQDGNATITGSLDGDAILDDAVVVIDPLGVLGNITRSATSLAASATSDYTFGFNSTVQWHKAGGLSVVFPSGFDVSGASAQVSGDTAPSSVTIDGQEVVLERPGGSFADPVPPGVNASVTISGIVNRGSSGSAGPFSLHLLSNNQLVPIATGSASAVTLTGPGEGGGPEPTTDDWDNDGVADYLDNCPFTSNADQADSDEDGVGTACDDVPGPAQRGDRDQDGVPDRDDNCPTVYNPDGQDDDEDGDGFGDACDESDLPVRMDRDQDGWANRDDNCGRVFNPSQSNFDGDRFGDLCDRDLDGDRVRDDRDTCPGYYNPSNRDLDEDGIGDACDDDIDGDAILNEDDDCPYVVGESCDELPEGESGDGDRDGDGIPDEVDNCRSVRNHDQANWDNDRQGDLCDRDDDNDRIRDTLDDEPFSPLPGYDDWF